MGRPGKEPDAEQEGPAPASLPPLQWVPGQMCPWKTDVLRPECGAGGRELGREEGERGEEPQLGNRMPIDVLLLFSILFIVESFKREQNGGGRCQNEASMLLCSSSPSPTLPFLFYASLQASL